MSSDGYLNYYFKYLDNYPQLDKSKEKELSLLILEGTESQALNARNELILGNLRLVISCANKFFIMFNKLVPLQDLIEYGNLGLIDASSRFDYTKGAFSTFATMRINAMISRGVDERDVIHIPDHHKYKLRAADRDNQSIEEYCEVHGLSDRQMVRMKSNRDRKIVSIEGMYESGENFDIPDNSQNAGDDSIRNNQLDILNNKIDELREDYRDVVKKHYFEDMHFPEIGRSRGVTRQRIEKLLSIAKHKLKQKLLTIKDELL